MKVFQRIDAYVSFSEEETLLLESVKRAGTRKAGLVTDPEFRRLASRAKARS